MKLHAQVGANIRHYRLAKGWSQEELAHVCGLHRTYISGLERGRRNPTLTVLEQICLSLNISPSDLLSGDVGNDDIL